MVQQNYFFHTFGELTKIVSTIVNSDNYKNAEGILLQLYNPKLEMDDKKLVEYITQYCSKACLTGFTCANIGKREFDIKDNPIELNVSYFFKTKVIELDFDMLDHTGFEAGRVMQKQLDILGKVKCIQLCYSVNSEIMHTFTNEFSHYNLPIFGGKAGRSIRALNTAYVYGRKCYDNGIVAIVFIGDSLKLYMDNSLGFKEIGVEMTVTKTENDNHITEINNRPAIEVYTKYLKIRPNNSFVQNVCEFPLIFHRKNAMVARVASGYTEEGALLFTSDVQRGEHFRLSYGSADTMFAIVKQSINEIKSFSPEAIYLFECGNRHRFLRDRYEREIMGYYDILSSTSITIGYSEICITPKGGGVLNSALVAIGLKEDDAAEDIFIPNTVINQENDDEIDDREYIPFLERILTILEKTSDELNEVNKELGKIAYTDQLTKIYNRWEIERKIEEAIDQCRNNNTTAALIFMDIDHFKRVNDTYGHDMGDVILRSVVDLIKDNLDYGHVFGRWGGEEFLYMVSDIEETEARELADIFRIQVCENEFPAVGHVTISLGVTMIKPDDTVESFVKRADEGLYQAKESGRNRVVFV
ncbi:MAG: GGDEF domain-containing protein [Butyrivibrio sp.]|nr:GGDEF domain-containing protein [Butyrivibrio sp.]